MAAKKFDPSKPHGTVHGDPNIAYFQDGEHFAGDGTLVVPTPPGDPVEDEVQRRVASELDTRVAAAVAAALAAHGIGQVPAAAAGKK